MSGEESLLREVRLALVMNGGVSLAIWIGGVTHEIDCLRRAADAADAELVIRPTSACYRELLAILQERVVVDVVAGASAGGINGGLLAAAVYAEVPLPALREIWITLGDFTKLLRSPSKREPPSLLQGDDVVLPELRRTFKAILDAAGSGPSNQPIYLYVTATDFYGTPVVFADSGNRRFEETDHRRVFVFEHPASPGHEIEAEAIAEVTDKVPGAMPDVGTFDLANAADLLARAARSSSSFPVAFEAHELKFEDGEQHWMIDGGVLDNQPFNPVLNRIATIDGGDVPSRRVVGYIVPYVTAPKNRTDAQRAPERPTARETSSAAGSLPRDLPKLDGLMRIRNELQDGRRSRLARDRFLGFANGADLEPTAAALFSVYRESRSAECMETFRSWTAKSFRPGAGEIGQLETQDPRDSLVGRIGSSDREIPVGAPWIPEPNGRVWEPPTLWTWGLSPSERIAGDALLAFRGLLRASPTNESIRAAKGFASGLVQTIRAMKFRASAEFARAEGTIVKRAEIVYAEPVKQLTQGFSELAEHLDRIPGAPALQRLIDGEIVRNAFGTQQNAVPPVFDFVHMSAGIRNSLGHEDETPEAKLAGMKLGHFAGFLKRSWRANDWMWGRLDGAEYAVNCVLDLDYLRLVPDLDGLISALGGFAFPAQDFDVLSDSWARTLNAARKREYATAGVGQAVTVELAGLASSDPREQFAAVLENAAGVGDPDVRAALLNCCRAALSARIQLEILTEELPEVASAVEEDLKNGASRGSSGAQWVLRETGKTSRDRVARFRSLRIGSAEDPQQEASSKLGIDVASTAAAVAAAAFSGSGGGLPAAVRAPLAALRGLTLVFNIIVRLLVRTPAVGVAAVLAASVALIWALTEPNALLNAALPGLAALVIGGATVLITMATSPLESPVRSGWQRVGLVTIIAVPIAILAVAFGLPFGWELDFRPLRATPLGTGESASWLVKRTGETARDVAQWLVVAAEGAALWRLLLGWVGRKLRIIDLWIYRWALLLAVGAVAVGAVHDRTVDSNRSWNGTILILILFGAISLAPLVAELTGGARWAWGRATSAQGWKRGFLSQGFLEVGIWLLLFGLLVPAAFVGWTIARGADDESPPATVTVTTSETGTAAP